MTQINTKIIKKLKPCKDRFDNWIEHYDSFQGSLIDFLHLEKITPQDKIWVAVRLMPNF